MTDALPAAALAVSTPSENGSEKSEQMDAHALWQTIAVRGGLPRQSVRWQRGLLARASGRRRRASTVALVALVGHPTGADAARNRAARWVVATVAGSAAALATLVSTPVVSQFLGCTPLGPIAWGQAVGLRVGGDAARGAGLRGCWSGLRQLRRMRTVSRRFARSRRERALRTPPEPGESAPATAWKSATWKSKKRKPVNQTRL